MDLKNKIIAIIPARGNSKRIKDKNIALLVGKPLIQYTIKAARNSKYISRIIVSTDNSKIALVSKDNGAEVIIRPKTLATDTASTESAIKHVVNVLRKYESYDPYAVVILQPTSPLRTTEDINKTIEEFLKKNSDSVETICLVRNHPYHTIKVTNGKMKPLYADFFTKRTQELPKIYIENGAVYVVKTEVIMKNNSRYGKKHRVVIMPYERSVDIDEPIDLKLAEFLIKNEK